jgi:hypothetical protein
VRAICAVPGCSRRLIGELPASQVGDVQNTPISRLANRGGRRW